MNGEIMRPEDMRVQNTLIAIGQRNEEAKNVIRKYAKRHAAMDVAIGAAGIFGLAIPALIAAIAAQAPFIYQPMARELAEVYNVEKSGNTGGIVGTGVVVGGIADIAGEFSTEFVAAIASELIAEAGLGTIAGFIPIVGGIIGAALDYVIATAMTWRVGTMVSIYYQNGGKWIGTRKRTYEIAKEMTGGLGFGVQDLVARFSGQTRPDMNVDFDSIPQKVPQVGDTQVQAAKQMLAMLLEMGTSQRAREVLQGKGFSNFVIDAAFLAVKNVATR